MGDRAGTFLQLESTARTRSLTLEDIFAPDLRRELLSGSKATLSYEAVNSHTRAASKRWSSCCASWQGWIQTFCNVALRILHSGGRNDGIWLNV